MRRLYQINLLDIIYLANLFEDAGEVVDQLTRLQGWFNLRLLISKTGGCKTPFLCSIHIDSEGSEAIAGLLEVFDLMKVAGGCK